MEPLSFMALLFVALFIALFSGVPIFAGLSAVGIISLFFALPIVQPDAAGVVMWESCNSFLLTAIPLFLIMGQLIMQSGISDLAYDAITKWMGRVPGGLAHSNIGACGLFAAISGASTVCAAAIGSFAIPAMNKRGYGRRLTYGSIAAGGSLGILIPPSIPFVIYGSMTGSSVGALFMAGVIPGIILMCLFMMVTLIWSLKNPSIAPRMEEKFQLKVAIWGTIKMVPMLGVILLVLGGIYAGIMTPTEAAGIGASGSLLICLAMHKLSWRILRETLLGTVEMTSMMLLIYAGASMVSYIAVYLGIPKMLVKVISDLQLSPVMILIGIYILFYVLGCFFDAVSMMVMTLPFLMPIVGTINMDPILFGVLIVILCEIGLLTPPVGLNIYVLRGLDPSSTTYDIVMGILPFLVAQSSMMIILPLFPALALWLPSKM
jgi:C4-dicarboxylate transporter DctM subunit